MKYTKSAFLDTIDFLKTIIYIFDLIVQIGYIGYLVYRISQGNGILITNIVLLAISFGYLLYHLITTKEFYTIEEVETKKEVKLIVKVLKRIVNAIVIGLSIYQLAINPDISGIDLFLTFIMVLGFMFSILGDIVLKVINSKAQLIISSLKYDLNELREQYPVARKPVDFIEKKMELTVDTRMVKRIKVVNHRQEMKLRRKKVFTKKTTL